MSDLCVHLYALCWNEERMLPFFFRHYDSIVDRYLVFDNDSTDRSRELLAAHPRVTLRRFAYDGSFLDAATDFYNRCWKPSRGTADWVLICNIDEHFDHADLRSYLETCTRQGVSLIVPHGYEMLWNEFPDPQCDVRPLSRQIRTGARSIRLDKPELFSPDHIREIHFEPGRHSVRPEGLVRRPVDAEVRMLHYRYLGLEFFSRRLSELGARIPAGDICPGHQYTWSDTRKREEFERLCASAAVLD